MAAPQARSGLGSRARGERGGVAADLQKPGRFQSDGDGAITLAGMHRPSPKERTVKNLLKFAGCMLFDFRCSLGMTMLRYVLRILPIGFSMREGISRGMADQVEYDRYAAYCSIQREPHPLDLARWRAHREWMRTRPGGKCKVRDTSHMYAVRETA